MSKLSKTDLKALIDANVTQSRVIWGAVLNEILTNFIDSLKPDLIVNSTGERNSLPDKYAGMLVYVRGSHLYVLEDDLTTWGIFVKNGYTQTEVDALISDKVSVDGGKVLSEQDFTTALKTKLDAIEDEATKNESDSALRDRSSHTGTQSISTITNLSSILSAISDDLGLLLGERFIVNKNIAYTDANIYEIDPETDFTILVDAAGGNKIVVLPESNANEKRCYNIKKIDSTGNTVTIYASDWQDSSSGSDSGGFQNIEFGDSIELSTQGELVNLQALGNNWYKISN